MKFQAHPLVVAAALGLVGPGALAEDDEDEAEAGLCDGCEQPLPSAPAAPRLELAPADGEWTWTPGEAPDAEAFHRVEIAWLKER